MFISQGSPGKEDIQYCRGEPNVNVSIRKKTGRGVTGLLSMTVIKATTSNVETEDLFHLRPSIFSEALPGKEVRAGIWRQN